jgi:hypothetical protein
MAVFEDGVIHIYNKEMIHDSKVDLDKEIVKVKDVNLTKA